MSDYDELSLQDHELKYILRKFGKKQSEENIERLKIWEKRFKRMQGGPSSKSYTKEDFYNWLDDNYADKLEDLY